MKLCGFEAGLDQPFFLIAGPCTAESEQLCIDVAGRMKEICGRLGIPYIFKASYDKANRSSGKSVRGLGLDEGMRIFSEVKRQIGVPVLTDVHSIEDIAVVAATVDVLQTPAFLCRQTDFIHAVASCGKPVNIKKGQFLAPGDMKHVVAKAREVNHGADNIMVCERGASFGYNNLVSDMRSLAIMSLNARPSEPISSLPPTGTLMSRSPPATSEVAEASRETRRDSVFAITKAAKIATAKAKNPSLKRKLRI